MSSLKKLAGHTAVYGLSTILGRFLSYVLTPFHTSIFPAHEFGVITELYSYIALLNVILTFGMETAYFRFATKDESTFLKSYNNALTSVGCLSLIFAAIIYFLAPQIAVLLNYSGKENIIRWISLILVSDAIIAVPFARLRLLNKIYLFAGAKISTILVNIFFNIFFLFLCPLILNEGWFPALRPLVFSFYDPSKGVEYVFISNLLANLFYLPFLIPSFRGLKISIDFPYLKQMLIYGFPILIMGIAGTINDVFSRIMLKELLPANFYPGKSSEAALGIFGACYKLSVFMALAIQAFRFASEPFFFSNAKDKNAPELFAKVMNYFVLCCMAIFILVSVNISWLSEVFLRREEYKEGLNIVPILLMANLFMGIYFNLSIWYKLTDKTYWGTYTALAGVIITISANFLFIPLLGYYGSAWASLCCYFIMAIISYLLGQKFYPMPYPIILIAGYIFVGAMLYIITLKVNLGGYYDLLFDNGLALNYVAGMFIVNSIINRRISNTA